jgi:hypothetical protein
MAPANAIPRSSTTNPADPLGGPERESSPRTWLNFGASADRIPPQIRVLAMVEWVVDADALFDE